MASRTRLYVGNIPLACRSRELEETFARFGKLREVTLKDKFAFVEYEEPRDASEAERRGIEGLEVNGSRLRIEFAKERLRVAARSGHDDRFDRPGRCYRCGGEGHLARDCREQDRSSRCYRCGSSGHRERSCDRSSSPRRGRSRDRSPPRRRNRSRSWSRSRSRSPPRRSRRSRSRSPPHRRRRSPSYSRSPSRSRSRSPRRASRDDRRRRRSPSRSPRRSPPRSPLRARSPVRSKSRSLSRSRSRSPPRGRRSYSRSRSRSPRRRNSTDGGSRKDDRSEKVDEDMKGRDNGSTGTSFANTEPVTNSNSAASNAPLATESST